MKMLPSIHALAQDVRYGLSLLRTKAAVTLAAIGSLALAIASTTVAFSLLDAIVLRPLPVSHPEELTLLSYLSPDDMAQAHETGSFSYPYFERAREAAKPMASVFAMSAQFPREITVDQRGSEPAEPELAYAQHVSGDAFNLLGLRPALGRLLLPSDDVRPGDHAVAVISHDYWRRRFQSDPNVLQRHLTIGKREFQIIGVMEPRFTGIQAGVMTDLWIPVMMGDRNAFTSAYWGWLRLFARVRPEASRDQVQQTLQLAFTSFRRDMVTQAVARSPHPPPPDMRERMINAPLFVRSGANGPSPLRSKLERPLWILAAVVALVLLIACSNVANLLIARAAARRREMALRISVGAGRARLVQQVLIESGLLALAAAIVGIALAYWIAPLIVLMLAASREPVRLTLALDWRLAAFLITLCATTTLLFGIAPALHASAVTPQDALKSGDAHQSSRRRLARLLVAAQVGFCFVVLFIAGLFLVTFRNLTTEDLGFRPGNLALIGMNLRDPQANPDQLRETWQQVQERLRQMPGVENVSYSGWSLFGDTGWNGTVRIEGQPFVPIPTNFLPISPGFVSTMGMRLMAGRELEPADLRVPVSATVPSPAVVSQTFVARYLPGQQAASVIGQRFQTIVNQKPVLREIVGVVADVHFDSIRDPAVPVAFFPPGPEPPSTSATVEVRTLIEPAALMETVRREVRQVNPAIRVAEPRLQSTQVADSLISERLLAWLSGFFAIVAMLLAAIGLYGVLTYTVLQRTKEIGIRVALGARSVHVVTAIMRQFRVPVAAGVVAGSLLAAGIGIVLSREMFGVSPFDPASHGSALLLFAAVSGVAAAPAIRRALRVDPATTLLSE
jgi:predicted permease